LRDLPTPALEIARLLKKYKDETGNTFLPAVNATVITSVATADSWHKGEYHTLFDVLGLKLASCKILKTCIRDPNTHQLVCGANGRKIPRNDTCIEYDQYASKDTWPAVSENLYQQLLRQNDVEPVDAIFHWGCISHQETLVPNHKGVDGWAWHEHWNILHCVAMARHALDSLKPDGTLVLKVRSFEMPETLGLVALLSCAFEDSRIFSNSYQIAELAMFVGSGFLGSDDKTVMKVKTSLKKNTRYQLHEIMCDELAVHSKFRATLKDAVSVREEMRRDHDYVAFITLQIVYHVQQCLRDKSSQFPYEQVEIELKELSRLDPITVDEKWPADVIDKIKQFLKTHRSDADVRYTRQYRPLVCPLRPDVAPESFLF
jgi:hypothetical protein